MSGSKDSREIPELNLVDTWKQQSLRIAASIHERATSFYKNSGPIYLFILVTSLFGHISTWADILGLLLDSSSESPVFQGIFDLFWNIGKIIVSIVFIYIGVSKDYEMRKYIEAAFAFIFNIIFLLSCAASIAIVINHQDFELFDNTGKLALSIGPASFFSITLFAFTFFSALYFRAKMSNENLIMHFLPFFFLVGYVSLNDQEYDKLLQNYPLTLEWQNIGNHILSLTMAFLAGLYIISMVYKLLDNKNPNKLTPSGNK
tara:strand:- start:1578 stop:2357 length:780 start_codon:yes stop_codon:yes gene_type:complete